MKGERRKWRRFVEFSRRERRLFLEALVFQLCIGLLLKVIPFRWIPHVFADAQGAGHRAQGTGLRAQGSGHRAQSAENNSGTSQFTFHISCLQQIKMATQRASKASPWRNKCLISSLAVRCMLRRRKIGSQISLGVAKGEDGKMIAHAWLKAGDFEVVERIGEYKELYFF